MDALSVVLYVSLSAAVTASVGAVISPSLRTRLLVLAGFLYAVAGVLGIPSIGVVFLVASLVSFTFAAREKVNSSRHA